MAAPAGMDAAAVEAGPRVVGQDDCTLAHGEALQGLWTQDQYLAISAICKQLIEFTDGRMEQIPMPTDRHQTIVLHLLFALADMLRSAGGAVRCAPLRLRIREGKFREPDLLLLRDAKDARRQNAYWLGADLVVEIVSPDDPGRDLIVKRIDYAEAGIPEYWIVNPMDETITVLVLRGSSFAEHGVFVRGEQAEGIVLPGFAADVAAVFDAE